MAGKPPLAAKIAMEMAIQGRKPKYIAAMFGKCEATFYERMKDPLNLTLKEFLAICKTLKMDDKEIYINYVSGGKRR